MKKFAFPSIVAMCLACSVLLSSCSQRLIDFTVISSKNVSLKLNKSAGKRVKGKSMQFFAIGVNIKDAIDDAIQQAGDADMLIDGVLRSTSYIFYSGYVVEGTAVNSASMKGELGEEEFKKWCLEHNAVQLGN